MNVQPRTWWIVFAALLLAGAGFYALLLAQGHAPAARATLALIDTLWTLWLVYGLIRWREHPAVRRVGLVLAFTFVSQLFAGVFFLFGMTHATIATVGIWAMGLLFFGGMLLVRAVLNAGHPILGVARTVVAEAMYMRVPLILMIIIALIVPSLPFVLDPQDLLRYRVQTFLTWSLMIVGVLLSLLTIFLGIITVTREVEQRQIFLTMTKPVSRGGYLFGKWLGIAAINLVLVAVSGAGIYTFTRILEDQGGRDDGSVREQVLVARQTIGPRPAGVDLSEVYRERLARLRAAEPGTYGQPSDPESAVSPALRTQIQNQILNQLHVVPPRGSRAFRFTGMNQENLGDAVQLRLRPRPASPSPDGTVYLFLTLNGYEHPSNPIRLAEGEYHVIDLPAELVRRGAGELVLQIDNPGRPHPADPQALFPQPSITFDVANGMQLLYRVGGFEGNYVRGLVMMWVRLSFLAMLGIAAGAYLSFPIACLLAMLVYFAAVGSGFIGESLDGYASYPADTAAGWDWLAGWFAQLNAKFREGDYAFVLRMFIKLIGSAFMAVVPAFGTYNPTPLVADGRWVSPRLLAEAAAWVGVVWTGAIALVAWLVWRRRELARVTV